MVLDWLTGKGDPIFWKEYLECFEKEDSTTPTRYVVFDCEKTGEGTKGEHLLSIGGIGITNDAISVNDFFEIFIDNNPSNNTNEAVAKLFQVNNIAVDESVAMQEFLKFIKNSKLIGHSTNLDIELLNQALKKMNLGKLKNEVLDVNVMHQRLKNIPEDHFYRLDELCDIYKVKKNDRSTASGNAFATALIFLKLKRKLKMK